MDLSEMQPTCSLQRFIETDVYDNPCATFIKFPIKEIRQACLEKIQKIKDIGTYHADWAEMCIIHLREIHDQYDYWKKILEWYIFAAEDEPILKRAIEFAIFLYKDSTLYGNLVSKLLSGRLKEDLLAGALYDQMPSLRAFFYQFLRDIYFNKWLKKLHLGAYSQDDWHRVQRALDIAIWVEDFNLLWQVEQIIMLIEENIIFPDQSAHWSARESNLAVLRKAEKLLKKAKHNSEAGEFE